MKIAVELPFDEQALVALLKWLRDTGAAWLVAHPEAPLLYDSGVFYAREQREVWRAVPAILARGREDCDSLAAWRAAELLARGTAALRPGDPGYEEIAAPGAVQADVIMTTAGPVNRASLYHCVTRYRLTPGGRLYLDDPSARLGMNGRRVDPGVYQRWRQALGPARAQEVLHAVQTHPADVSGLPPDPLSGAPWPAW